jgi:tetratricopeptide (TPR) repeat protein
VRAAIIVPLALSLLIALGAPASGRQQATTSVSPSRDRNAGPAEVIILVFDLDGMSAGSVQRARSVAEAYIRHDLGEGMVAGIVAGGKLVGNRLTGNRDDLLKAVASVRPNADVAAPRGDVPLDRGDERAAEIASTLDAGNRATENSEARSRALRGVATLRGLARSLASVPGHKTIVWISDTFSAPAGERAKVTGRENEVRQLVAEATGASITITGLGARAAAPTLSREDLWQALISGTGGTLVHDEKDLANALKAATSTTAGSPPAAETAERIEPAAPAAVAPLPASVKPAPTAASPAAPPPVAAAAPSPVVATPPAARPPEERPTPAAGGTSLARLTPAGGGSRDANLRDTLSGTVSTLPPDLMAQARAGWDAYQAGDTKAALAALAPGAAHPAAPPWIHYVLGWAQFAEGNIDAARAQWLTVRASVPEFQRVYFDLADCDLRQDKSPEALGVLREAEGRWPASADVLNAAGVVETSLGQFDDAVRTFERAVGSAPTDTSAHFNLARVSELRYLRDLRAESAAQTPPATGDLDRAAAEYRRVVEMKGPEAGDAAAGLVRTSALDASKLDVSPPALLASYNDSALGGIPIRLAWSADGTSLCIGALRVSSDGKVTARPIRIITVSNGGLAAAADPPDWATTYWTWKAALSAPWLPSLKIQTERRRAYSMYDMGAPTSAGTLAFRLGGEVVGESIPNPAFVAGTTYSWSPFAMGALVYVDKRGVLVILDKAGRKHDIKGARGTIFLPAWSPDGKSIAYLEKSTHGFDLRIVDVGRGER